MNKCRKHHIYDLSMSLKSLCILFLLITAASVGLYGLPVQASSGPIMGKWVPAPTESDTLQRCKLVIQENHRFEIFTANGDFAGTWDLDGADLHLVQASGNILTFTITAKGITDAYSGMPHLWVRPAQVAVLNAPFIGTYQGSFNQGHEILHFILNIQHGGKCLVTYSFPGYSKKYLVTYKLHNSGKDSFDGVSTTGEVWQGFFKHSSGDILVILKPVAFELHKQRK